MKLKRLVPVLMMLCAACGPADEDADCYETWWTLEEDGALVAEGDLAQIGDTAIGSQGYFASNADSAKQSCAFLSTTKLNVGQHDSLTCITETAQGPNPQWIAAKGSEGEPDQRPRVITLSRDGEYTIGTMSGAMTRLDTLSYSPPNIEERVVNYVFTFRAVPDASLACDSIQALDPGACNKDKLVEECSAGGCSVEGGTCYNSDKSASIAIPDVVETNGKCRNILSFVNKWCG